MNISLELAEALNTASFNKLAIFFERSIENECLTFTHANFYYDYTTKPPKFNRVEISCNNCGMKPERNVAGIGAIYLLKTNGAVVPICSDCVASLHSTKFGKKPAKPKQLVLFHD